MKCIRCGRELSFTGGIAWIHWHFGLKDGYPRKEPVCVFCFTPIVALRRMFNHLRRACT